MISAWSALRMGLSFVRCGSAICMRGKGKFDSEFMPAVRKIPHSVPFLQIWSSWNANGFLTTDRLRMKMRAVRPDGKTGIREAFLLLPGKSGMCPNQEPASRSDPFSLRTVSPSSFSTYRS